MRRIESIISDQREFIWILVLVDDNYKSCDEPRLETTEVTTSAANHPPEVSGSGQEKS